MKRFIGSSALRITPPSRPIRVGVFGAGKAAKFHIAALDLLPGVSVAGVCSRSGTSAEALVAGRPGAISTSDPAVLIDPDRVDAAIVAVTADQNPHLARQVLEARIPLLVEKPAALCASEVEDLAQLAAAQATLGVVAVNRRYYSLVQGALELVRQRGPVRGVLVEGHEATDQLRREGAITDEEARRWLIQNSVHYVDLLRMAGGEVDEVESVGIAARGSTLDHLSASIRFASGAIGTYVAHWNSAARPLLRLYGEEVSAEVSLLPPEEGLATFAYKRRVRLTMDPVDLAAKAGVLEQDLAFVRAVADGRSSVPFPASDLADHAATLRLAEAIGGRTRT